jgi:essential nuclear protein 1
MPRQAKGTSTKPRHDPLHVEIDADDQLAKYGNVSRPGKRKNAKKSEETQEEVCMTTKSNSNQSNYGLPQTMLDSKTSRKILELARDQQEELELKEELNINEKESQRCAP